MTNKKDVSIKETNEIKDINTTSLEDTGVTEINYDLVASGPLYVDPRHKKPGYEYAFVSDEPGLIESYKRLGYMIVQDDVSVGDNVASKSTRFGSAVTVQSKCGRMLVLMAITKENFEKYMAHRDKENRKRNEALGHIEGVPEQYQVYRGQHLGEYKITRK